MTAQGSDSVRLVRGRSVVEVPGAELAARIAEYEQLLVDLGTGDGRFVLRFARDHPEVLVIGVDALAQQMSGAARRSTAKPARGGVGNALFLVAPVEHLPAVITAAATRVTVNFPWGSLLAALARPDPRLLARIADILQPGGRLTTLLNASATDDRDYTGKLRLPPLEREHIEQRLIPGWQAAGLRDVSWRELERGEAPDFRTTWGQRLVRGSGRQTVRVEAVRRSAS